jgi:hypothetical protein
LSLSASDLAGSASPTIAEILAKLGTDPKTGLNPGQLQERLSKKEKRDDAFGREKKTPALDAVHIFQQRQRNRSGKQHADRLAGNRSYHHSRTTAPGQYFRNVTATGREIDADSHPNEMLPDKQHRGSVGQRADRGTDANDDHVGEHQLLSAKMICHWPETDSPHWLMIRGRFAEAAQAFIRIMPEQREAVLQIISNAGNQSGANSIAPPKAQGMGILFSRGYRGRTALVAIPWFLMDIATYGVGLFTPIILGAIDVSANKGGVIAHDFADARGSAAIDLFLLLGFVLGIWAVPRFGRIPMQAIGFASMAFGMLLLMIAVHLSNSSLHIPLVFAGFILFNLLMNAGPNSTTFTLAPILFPTQLRATASGFAAGVAKIGATLGVFVLPILKGRFGLPPVLAMMAAVSIVGLAVTLVFGHEDTE